MGLLDEAIREHLDLKRRRGADPSEIDRLEREALGPVRRAPHDAPDALLDGEGPVAGGYPADEAGPYGLDEEPDWGDAPEEPMGADPTRLAERPAPAHWDEPATEIAPGFDADHAPEARDRPYDPPRHHEIAEEWEAHERHSMAAEPASDEPGEPVPPHLEQETMEHDVEAENRERAEHPQPREGEDVLEETPEFLQDTPDHDRLWFEQRPPRDFDFDD